MSERDLRSANRCEEDSYSLREIFSMMAARWVWFAAAVALSLGIAILHIYRAPKLYVRSAAILIKDSRRGNVASAAFDDIAAARAIPNLDNEMFLLGSRRLVTEVVRELKLDVGYAARRGLRRVDLYGVSPVEVTFPGDCGQASGLRITKHGDALRLSDFHAAGHGDIGRRMSIVCNPGDTVTTPIGRVVVNPTRFYDDFKEGRSLDVRKNTVEAAAGYYVENMDVSLNSESGSVIVLTLTDVSAARAEQILNTLLKAYRRDVIADRTQVAEVSRRFIGERLELLEEELAAEERRILEFREAKGLVDIEGQTAVSMNEGTRLRSEIYAIENQIALAGYLLEYLGGVEPGALIPVNTGIRDDNLDELVADYNKEAMRRGELLKGSNERNPTIVSLTSSLTAKFTAIVSSVENLLEQSDVNLERARTREGLAEGSMATVPGHQAAMLSLTRRRDVKEQLYLYLLNKKEENDLGRMLAGSDARIVQEAAGPDVPVSPKPVRVVVFALLLGLAVPFAAILLANLLRTTVNGAEDVERRVSLPVLGEIPLVRGKHSDLALYPVVEGAAAEAFRMLRAEIAFRSGSDSGTILVTSGDVGAGKTFCAVNIAAALVRSGRSVVVVDGDMRGRSLSRMNGAEDCDAGLSLYLSDESVGADRVVKANGCGGADAVFAGAQPSNPAELLSGQRFEQLITELKRRYDYVVVDSLPVFAVADAVISARVADLTVCVVRVGATPLRLLDDLEKLYGVRRLPDMTVVLNRVPPTSRQYVTSKSKGRKHFEC